MFEQTLLTEEFGGVNYSELIDSAVVVIEVLLVAKYFELVDSAVLVEMLLETEYCYNLKVQGAE